MGPAPPERTGSTIFAAGDLVADRYEIVRFVARGGVAEVYVAHDRALRHPVALKAIRREYSANRQAIERFKREIHLARQVTHPNVCRIYDLGQERRGVDDVLFLTMELLEGETLHERIRRDGPFTPAEALPLVRQMAAGLEAAQKVGVVHRDLKTGNVMLVPAEGEEGGVRVVIADFGMARMASEDGETLAITTDDLIVGSPAYMAPEQVESGPISAATDIYSVGVVLFEMVTGRFPFQAETALATALMRLSEKPPEPRSFVSELDERWNRAILRCLERDPQKRFASAGELVEALAGPSPAGRRSTWAVGLAGAAAVAVASAAWLLWPAPKERETPAPVAGAVRSSGVARPSIALLGFKNLSGREDAAWLSMALAEMLSMEVAAGEALRVIPGENVVRTKIELGLADSDGLDSDALGRVAEILGSDLVVEGSYLLAGSNGREIRIDLRIKDVASGETVARVSERGTEAGVLDLIENAGRALRAGLGVGAVSPAAAAAVRASRPASPESARLYAEGLAKLRRYDARAALDLLRRAAEIDPRNPMIRSALSSAWGVLGYWPKAREEAERAFELAGDLSRRDRLWVEAHYRELAGERQKAAEIYRVLWDYFPDNLEVGLELAKAQTAIGQAEAALETVEQLRSLPGSAGNAPRIDIAEARAARALAQYQLQQERAARAARAGEALGARLLVARARELEAGAWRDLGEPEKALAAYEEARAIHAAANNRGPVARILIAVAKILRYQGRFDEARALNEEALTVAREIGDQGSVKHALNTLAIILRQQGRLKEALEMHELEVETNREIGDGRSLQVALTSLGVVERQLGDLEGAAERFSEALASGRETGNQRSVEINLNLLGEVLAHQGRLADARRHFEQALEVNRETRSPRGRAYYLSNLADLDLAGSDLDSARRRYEEALEIRRSLGEKTNVAFSLLSLARLALEEGSLEAAAEMALDAAAEFEAGQQADALADALAFLSLVRLAEGRRAEAADAAAHAQALVEGGENRGTSLRVALQTAQVAAATDDVEGALATLRRAEAEARALGYLSLGLEAGLALGRLELEAGREEAGAARLAQVAKEAEARGFHLLAAKAMAAGS